MESRWYVPVGKKLAETKISERSHALHVTREKWGEILYHLDKKRLLQEAADKEKAKIQKMRDENKAMTDSWADSVENLRIQKELQRSQKYKLHKTKSMVSYYEMAAKQEIEREEYVDRMRRSMYINSGPPRELNSALLQSEVAYERQKQLEYNEFLKAHEREEEAKWARVLRERDAKTQKEDEEKKIEKAKRVIADREFYVTQIEEKEAAIKAENAMKSEEGKQDAMAIKKENEELEKYLQEEKREANLLARKEFSEFMQTQAEEKRQKEIEDKEIDEIISIHHEAKERIDCLIRERAAQIQKEYVAKHEHMGKIIAKEERERILKEQAIIRNAIVEQEEAAKEKERKEKERAEQARKERQDDLEEHLRKKEIQEREKKEIEKWELLNRLKQEEVIKEYDENRRIENHLKLLEHKKELDEQVNYKKKENEIYDNVHGEAAVFMKQKLKDEDEQFLQYGQECIEYAKNRGRDTRPVEKVIARYIKDNYVEEDQPEKEIYENYVDYLKETAQKELLVKADPGQRAHHPRSDPTYGRCKCWNDRLFK